MINNRTSLDEVRSVQRYVSWAFPDLIVLRSRPKEDVKYGILIYSLNPIVTQVGQYKSIIKTPYVVHYDAETYDEAMVAKDKLVSLSEIGIDPADHSKPGHKRRFPLWKWPDGGTPRPDDTEVDGYLRISDTKARVDEQEEPGRFVVTLEFFAESYIITYDHDSLTTVNVINTTGENP